MPQELPDPKPRAVAAIKTAIDTHRAARDKYNAMIARKDIEGQDTGIEDAKVASLDVQIGNLEDELAEYQAATTVVRAPTLEEITAAQAAISKIKTLAVADAALASGQAAITSLLKASLDLKNKNAKA